VSQNGVELGVDSSRLAVTGNSVGGNMAAAVTLMVHDKGGANIVYQQLLWPALSAELDTESYRAYGEGRFLPRAFMQYGWDHYAPDPETRKHRYAAPLQATTDQLRGLPPTLIQTAENDVLRDEGEAYARKLDEAGVSVTNTRYKQQRPSPPQLVTRSRTMTTPVTSSMDAAEPLARRFNVPSPADGAAATVARPAIQARPRRPGGG
jgi:acetyl esterase/lipase